MQNKRPKTTHKDDVTEHNSLHAMMEHAYLFRSQFRIAHTVYTTTEALLCELVVKQNVLFHLKGDTRRAQSEDHPFVQYLLMYTCRINLFQFSSAQFRLTGQTSTVGKLQGRLALVYQLY